MLRLHVFFGLCDLSVGNSQVSFSIASSFPAITLLGLEKPTFRSVLLHKIHLSSFCAGGRGGTNGQVVTCGIELKTVFSVVSRPNGGVVKR